MPRILRREPRLVLPGDRDWPGPKYCSLLNSSDMMMGASEAYVSAVGWRIVCTIEGASLLWWRVDELMMFTSLDGTGTNLTSAPINTIYSGSQFGEIPDNAFQGTPASSIDSTSQMWSAGSPSGAGAYIGQNFGGPTMIRSMKLYQGYTSSSRHYAAEVGVEYSNDLSSWTRLKTFTTYQRTTAAYYDLLQLYT